MTELRDKLADLWQQKYFEMERAHSNAVDKIGELTARVMLRERELAERSADKSRAEEKVKELRAAYDHCSQERHDLGLKLSERPEPAQPQPAAPGTDLMSCCKIRAHNDLRLQSDGNKYYYASIGVEVALAYARPIIEAEQRAKDAEAARRIIVEEYPHRPLNDIIDDFADAVRARLAPQKTDPSPAHDYTSTACQHGKHDQCRKVCKFCPAQCKCECHAPPKAATPEERVTILCAGGACSVALDREWQISFAQGKPEERERNARRYRLGLIAEIQAGSGEGVAS